MEDQTSLEGLTANQLVRRQRLKNIGLIVAGAGVTGFGLFANFVTGGELSLSNYTNYITATGILSISLGITGLVFSSPILNEENSN